MAPSLNSEIKASNLKNVGPDCHALLRQGKNYSCDEYLKYSVDRDAISSVIYLSYVWTRAITIKPKIVMCTETPTPALNVGNYVLSYMNRALALRAALTRRCKPKPTQLLLSRKTKCLVKKRTLSRWQTTILGMANIDVGQFRANSYRGAGLLTALE